MNEAGGDQDVYYGDELDEDEMKAVHAQMMQEQAYAEQYGQED